MPNSGVYFFKMTSAAMSRRAKLLEDHEKNMMSETNKVISEEAEDARKVREVRICESR